MLIGYFSVAIRPVRTALCCSTVILEFYFIVICGYDLTTKRFLRDDDPYMHVLVPRVKKQNTQPNHKHDIKKLFQIWPIVA